LLIALSSLENLFSSIEQRVEKRADAEIFSLRFPIFDPGENGCLAEFSAG
jgi:hypothetical protein